MVRPRRRALFAKAPAPFAGNQKPGAGVGLVVTISGVFSRNIQPACLAPACLRPPNNNIIIISGRKFEVRLNPSGWLSISPFCRARCRTGRRSVRGVPLQRRCSWHVRGRRGAEHSQIRGRVLLL